MPVLIIIHLYAVIKITTMTKLVVNNADIYCTSEIVIELFFNKKRRIRDENVLYIYKETTTNITQTIYAYISADDSDGCVSFDTIYMAKIFIDALIVVIATARTTKNNHNFLGKRKFFINYKSYEKQH